MAPIRSSNPAPHAAGRVLIADDQSDVLEALRLLLHSEGYSIEAVSSPSALVGALESDAFDAILMDVNYSTCDPGSLDLLTHVQALDSTLPVIVMTDTGTGELAVEAMRRGARDFIPKPWEKQRLLCVLRTQIELSRALRRGQRLEAENRLLENISLKEAECLLIKKALSRYKGNISQAADALGLSRSALYRRLQKYGI